MGSPNAGRSARHHPSPWPDSGVPGRGERYHAQPATGGVHRGDERGQGVEGLEQDRPPMPGTEDVPRSKCSRDAPSMASPVPSLLPRRPLTLSLSPAGAGARGPCCWISHGHGLFPPCPKVPSVGWRRWRRGEGTLLLDLSSGMGSPRLARTSSLAPRSAAKRGEGWGEGELAGYRLVAAGGSASRLRMRSETVLGEMLTTSTPAGALV